MLIPNESIEVADWWFEYSDEGCIRFKDYNQIYDFLLKCQATYKILTKAELFYIERIQFTSWMKYDVNTDENPHKTQKRDVVARFFHHIHPAKLADECLEKITGNAEPFYYPLHIKFYGWGYIFNEFGHRIKRPTLMRFETITMGFPTIDISTYSDVWLPYDVYGKPQPKVYELNAPRLQKALMEIRDVLGIEPVIDNTEIADQHEDFTISNKRDSLGDILVYDTAARRVL